MRTLNCSCIPLAVVAGTAVTVASASLVESGVTGNAAFNRASQITTSSAVEMPIAPARIPVANLPEQQFDHNVLREAVRNRILNDGAAGYTLDGRPVYLATERNTDHAPQWFDYVNNGDQIASGDREAARQANCACPYGDCVVVPGAVASLTENEDPCGNPEINDLCFPTEPSAIPTLNINSTGLYTICGTNGGSVNYDAFRLVLNDSYALQFTVEYDSFPGTVSVWWPGTNANQCNTPGLPMPNCTDFAGWCVLLNYGTFTGAGSELIWDACDSSPLAVDGDGNPAPLQLPAGEYYYEMVMPFTGTPCGTWYNATIEVTDIATGACCTGDSCTITTLTDCVASDGVYRGNDTECSPNPCCNVDLSGADYVEAEQTCDIAQDPDANGGCLLGLAPAIGFEIFEANFSTNPCDVGGTAVITGTFGTRDDFLPSSSSGFVLDIDAYQFTLDQQTQVTVTIFSNAPFFAFLNQGSNDPNDPIVCGEDIAVASIAEGLPCETGQTMTACLPAGTHYIDIFPDLIDGAFQGVACGTPYRIEITCNPVCNTGACALPDGTCADNTDLPACIAAGGVYFGDDSTCAADAVFCDVCDPTNNPVGLNDDVCADFTDDTTNGGCFALTPAFTDLTGFITGPTLSWCGSAGVQIVDDGAGGVIGLGDDDWYEFTLTGTQFVTFSVEANANVFISIVPNLGLLTCASIDPDSTITGVAYTVCDAEGPAEISACLPAGTHALLVRGQSRPCGFRYSATLSFDATCPDGACCLPDGTCQQTNEANCNETLGGIFAGIGVDCMDAGCCDFDCPMGAVVENEPACGDDYDDGFNGGCNSNPVVFQNIAYSNPVTFCGVGGTFFDNTDPQNPVALRDTDWITVDLPAGVYRFSFDSNFNADVLFFTSDDGIDVDCGLLEEEFFFGVGFDRCEGGIVGWTFFADLRLTVFVGAVGTTPCSGDEWQYSFNIERFDNVLGACCIPDESEPTGVRCEDSVSAAVCIADLGGVFNQDECCDDIVCESPGDPEGSCCFACSGSSPLPCFEATEADCTAAGGTYLGDNTTCATFDCSNLCSGDINGDNRTNLDDFAILALNFGNANANRGQGDLNCDGTVNLDDFAILALDFGCDKTALFP